VTYRDELEAARAQVDELQRELEGAKEEIRALAKAPGTQELVVERHEPPVRSLTSNIYYDPPRTYFPLLLMLPVVARAAWHRRPGSADASAESDSLVVIAASWVLWAFARFVWAPIYVACLFLIVLPYAGALALALSIPLMPVIALARLRRGTTPSHSGEGWPEGLMTEHQGAMALWMLLSFSMAPLLVVFIPLLSGEDE